MTRVEPSADMRAAARGARELFLSLLEQGFSEEQAVTMIGIMLGQAAAGGSTSGDK